MDEKLWFRIQQYEFDQSSHYQFHHRLAHENGWTQEFALRAIFEYRRFVYMAAISSFPVCPSDEVDQVWHTHLLDSEKYFNVWCKQILGFDLHHHPSRGGNEEFVKHYAMYEQTLREYERVFGEAPSSELWPEPGLRFRQVYTRVKNHSVSLDWNRFPVLALIAYSVINMSEKRRKLHEKITRCSTYLFGFLCSKLH
ncbi:MAG TPA: hypothetical protein VEA59_05355 [Patescibacteria group bacterium]|nr:hypothetical protein [Patescibacteria group bacterium]